MVLAQELPQKVHAEHSAQFGQLRFDYVDEFEGLPRDLITRDGLREPSHVVFGYHPYWRGSDWENYDYNQLSHIAWFNLAMDNSGNITDANGWPWNGLVDLAHSHGVKVIVTVTNFDNTGIGILLGDAIYRQNAIDNLIARVVQGNADGVNIDFEFVPSSARNDFNTFMHDLTQAFHDQIPGSEVSIAMPSVDWSSAYDYDYLSDNSDGLMIMAYGYYWSGSSRAGPNSPLYSGLSSWHIQRTIEDYLTKTGDDGSQLILGLPWYGRDWEVVGTVMNAEVVDGTSGSSILYPTAESRAQTYGKQYNSQVHGAWYNYNNGDHHQVWYDDSLSLATKYNYAIEMGIKGIGIWALGYDGGSPEIWGGLSDAFGALSAPQVSSYYSVINNGDGSIGVNCAPSTHSTQYQVYTSYDGESFVLSDSSSTPQITLHGLTANEPVYIKTRNVNDYGHSNYSEVLGTVASTEATSRILIVQGFERTSGTTNNFDYIIEHGSAIHAHGRLFDAASNDAIENGSVELSDYDLVDWISGEEGSTNTSFSPGEQSKIMSYLDSGGRLFISGSEIGYDLEQNGTASDINFYHNYLKADYISDNTSAYSMNGFDTGIFSGLSGIDFDDGSHGSYDVDYPDGIKPYGGSISNLTYDGTVYEAVGGAGIQYFGHFGESTKNGGLVYLGVGFEAIYPESARNVIMSRVIDYLEVMVDVDPTPQYPDQFQVSTAYPNPFNGSFSLRIQSNDQSSITINLYNLKGQLLHQLQRTVSNGDNYINIDDLANIGSSSGVYVVQVTAGTQIYTQNITYLK